MTALGAFLSSRRARIDPRSVGLPALAVGSSRRRVPGLRREELAQLAGISVEYYQRLEQGRAKHPSDEVLDAVADALRLDAVERDHLRDLARPVRRPVPSAGSARPELQRMLELIDKVPALVISDCFDVLAHNALAAQIFEDQDNMARYLFLDPAAREFYVEWPDVAAATVAQLRLVDGRYPQDRELAALATELSTGSAEFRRLWTTGDVTQRTHGGKTLRHPQVGLLSFDYENLELPGDPRQRLVTFTPDPATATAAALLRLAATRPSRRFA